MLCQDSNLVYLKTGNGNPLIMLHGWGANKEIFAHLKNELEKYYTVYVLDLPGFGQSSINGLKCFMDYVILLRTFIKEQGINDPIIIGHSFGGRIAIRYASMYDVKKLVLISTPGIRNHKLLFKLKTIFYKIKKRFGFKNGGSNDYKKASLPLRKVLVSTVNYDLKPYLSKIKAPTIIMHGKLDKTVNYKMALKMFKRIKKCRLLSFKYASHYPFLDYPREFIISLKEFLND